MVHYLPVRFFTSSSMVRTAVQAVDKSLLSKLRKSTGYSISHCKKALQLHNNDLEEANKWLAAQAQAEGWAKATKLAGRTTSQGLLGIAINEDHTQAAMLELNCETDFVARNSIFVELASDLTRACLTAGTSMRLSGTDAPTIHKEAWNGEQLAAVRHSDGATLADKVALAIGLCGENMALSRAIKVGTVGEGLQLFGYTHPAPMGGTSTVLGKFGAVVAVRPLTDRPLSTDVLKHLCLQVIGMNPESIGTPEELQQFDAAEAIEAEAAERAAEAAERADEVKRSEPTGTGEEKQEEEAEEEATAPVTITEKVPKDKFLLKQTWLNDEDFTVEEVLQDAGVEVVDFLRMQVGETSSG